MRLTDETLALAAARAARAAELPGYDRARAEPGVVHLGLGAFTRAHQAVVFDDLLRAGHDTFAVTGVSLRNRDVADALNPQDGLYTLAIRSPTIVADRIIGCVREVLHAPSDPAVVLDRLADRRTHLVTVTVTEKGYPGDPATGALDEDHATVVHDLAHPDRPAGLLGYLVGALRRRRDERSDPFVVMSCDNLPANGERLRSLCAAMASLIDPALGEWIMANVAFPCSMVDRIVPATTDALRTEVAARIGLTDAWPVLAEPYTQWVLEASPTSSVLASAGVDVVAEVAPWEQLKLRVLNALHSSAAYLGLAQHATTIAEVVAQPANGAFLHRVIGEILPTLRPPAGVDARAYASTVLERFANPALGHRCAQVAMDGSQKLPQRLLPTMRARIAQGAPLDATARIVALWATHVLQLDPSTSTSTSTPVDDPLADRFRSIALAHRDPADMVRGLLRIRAIFGDDLGRDPRFVTPVVDALQGGSK
jgi:fructuronate reductase